MMATKKTILDFISMKENGIPLTWITAYDLPFAQVTEESGIDMILVGDSGGMVQLGYLTTNPVTMDEMIFMASSARRGAPNTFIVGDMPQGSYEVSDEEAVRNALRFVKECASDAIKLEGGRRVATRVRSIVNAGIPVVGHLGLTPQSTTSFGGYRVQGKTVKSFEDTLEDALALQEAGAFAILLEAMPAEPAAQIAAQLEIPIYGIGAGGGVDGQLVIMHDLMGFYQSFRPWFAKCYVPEVAGKFAEYLATAGDLRKLGRTQRSDGLLVLAKMALEQYVTDVHSGEFPGDTYSYSIKDEQLADLKKSSKWVE
jgi:3-methyl-2-oxobutanoate hydroxymethyltransferase